MVFEISQELEDKCKFYGTSMQSCNCEGFKFRRSCRHTTYLNEKVSSKYKQLDLISNSIPIEGMDSMKAIEMYGDDVIDEMLTLGNVFEKSGKLIPIR